MTSVYAVGQRLELSLKKRIVPIFGQMEGCWKKIYVFSIPQAFSAVLLDAGHRLELSGTAVLRLSTKLLSWQVGEIARFMLDPSSHHLAPFFLWIWNFKHWSTPPPAFAPNGSRRLPFGDYGLASQPLGGLPSRNYLWRRLSRRNEMKADYLLPSKK